jgi:hypothetical protein
MSPSSIGTQKLSIGKKNYTLNLAETRKAGRNDEKNIPSDLRFISPLAIGSRGSQEPKRRGSDFSRGSSS